MKSVYGEQTIHQATAWKCTKDERHNKQISTQINIQNQFPASWEKYIIFRNVCGVGRERRNVGEGKGEGYGEKVGVRERGKEGERMNECLSCDSL